MDLVRVLPPLILKLAHALLVPPAVVVVQLLYRVLPIDEFLAPLARQLHKWLVNEAFSEFRVVFLIVIRVD